MEKPAGPSLDLWASVRSSSPVTRQSQRHLTNIEKGLLIQASELLAKAERILERKTAGDFDLTYIVVPLLREALRLTGRIRGKDQRLRDFSIRGIRARAEMIHQMKSPLSPEGKVLRKMLRPVYPDSFELTAAAGNDVFAPSGLAGVIQVAETLFLRRQQVLDLRSGDGRMLVVAGLLGATARGMELDEGLFREAITKARAVLLNHRFEEEKTTPTFVRWSRVDGQFGSVELQQGDFLGPEVSFKETDIMYRFSVKRLNDPQERPLL